MADDSLASVRIATNLLGREKSNFLQIVIEEAIYAVEAYVEKGGELDRDSFPSFNVRVDRKGELLTRPRRYDKIDAYKRREKLIAA